MRPTSSSMSFTRSAIGRGASRAEAAPAATGARPRTCSVRAIRYVVAPMRKSSFTDSRSGAVAHELLVLAADARAPDRRGRTSARRSATTCRRPVGPVIANRSSDSKSRSTGVAERREAVDRRARSGLIRGPPPRATSSKSFSNSAEGGRAVAPAVEVGEQLGGARPRVTTGATVYRLALVHEPGHVERVRQQASHLLGDAGHGPVHLHARRAGSRRRSEPRAPPARRACPRGRAAGGPRASGTDSIDAARPGSASTTTHALVLLLLAEVQLEQRARVERLGRSHHLLRPVQVARGAMYWAFAGSCWALTP